MVDLRTTASKLNDKVAIVTGANMGIGKGIAQAFASEGAKVVLAARNVQRLNAVADGLRSLGGLVLSVPTDVSHEAEVIALFETTMREFGRLDILVNNAGVSLPATLEQTSLEIWQRTIDVNLTGPFLCTREAMKIMKPQGGGRIINIGSISAQMPRHNFAAYGCSKAGLVSLTKTAQMTDTPGEPAMEVDDVVKVVMAMATLPLNVNMFETIVLPVTQLYLGRG